MASHTKTQVMTTIRRDGVVPVFFAEDLDVAKAVASSVVSGGLSTLEFTNRGDDALGLLETLVAWSALSLPDLIFGVGSIVDAASASRAIDAGANFVFAPSLSAEVSGVCNERNILYVPGCATPTEIQSAYRMGCDVVKLFPAGSIGGPEFLRAVRAPCPWVDAIPTGGVEPTVESLAAWYGAGAPAVGLGSRLFPQQMLIAGDWAGIEQRVASVVDAVATARAAPSQS